METDCGKQLTQGHTTSKGKSWASNSDSLTSESVQLTTLCGHLHPLGSQ